jgi:valyl-tRNA synthetase
LVEYVHVREYYLKEIDFLEEISKFSHEQIRFFPPESIAILMDWINSISSDWPVSRRRFYGTELPIWYCKKCGTPYLPPPGKYYQPWRETPPTQSCKKCDAQEFIGEERTFDTWVDSGVSALYIMELAKKLGYTGLKIPVSMRPQGIDIVRTWLFYSLLRVYQLTGKPAFNFVRLSGMGLDEHGHAMHRHLGNVVYPEPMVNKYGADAFRLWSASESKLGSNYLFSESRVVGSRKFITKLWNIARFISQFSYREGDKYSLEPADVAILEKLDDLIVTCKSSFDRLDPFDAANSIRYFVWNIFADHYVEAIKSRAYNKNNEFATESSKGAIYTLYYVLNCVVKLLAPIAPFVTERIYQDLLNAGKSVHLAKFPQPKGMPKKYSELFDKFIHVNSVIWNYKRGKSLSLASPIASLCLPQNLDVFEKEIMTMHKVGLIFYGSLASNDFERVNEEIQIKL